MMNRTAAPHSRCEGDPGAVFDSRARIAQNDHAPTVQNGMSSFISSRRLGGATASPSANDRDFSVCLFRLDLAAGSPVFAATAGSGAAFAGSADLSGGA